LYCRACIVQSLLEQRAALAVQATSFEAQQAADAQQQSQQADAAQAARVAAFQRSELSISSAPSAANANKNTLFSAATAAQQQAKQQQQANQKQRSGYIAVTTTSGATAFAIDKGAASKAHVHNPHLASSVTSAKPLGSHWVPGLTPSAKPQRVKAPRKHTQCPAGKHVLRLKHLRPVRFTLAHDDEQQTSSNATGMRRIKYACCVCRRVLTNSTRMAVMRPCGHVLCTRCVNQFVAKDKACAHCGAACASRSDVIPLEQGASGFAAGGAKTVSSLLSPALQC
jgi:nitric oxide synthase-interacting protein